MWLKTHKIKMVELEKIELILEKLKDFDTWKEFKNDPDWLKKELDEKFDTLSNEELLKEYRED
jgi:hypothetical protein